MNIRIKIGVTGDLKPSSIKSIIDGEAGLALSAQTKEKIQASNRDMMRLAQGSKAVYGLNTGFGPLCNKSISAQQLGTLQENILKSHSVGVGEQMPHHLVRAMLLFKIHALSLGHSGVPLSTIERIIWHLEEDVIPIVPSQGSVGASGDLAPLAHLFLPLIGAGEVIHEGEVQSSADALKKFKKEPLKLGPKEGLALINGTQFMLAYAFDGLMRLERLLDSADLIAAMSLESLMGSASPFSAKLHSLRPHQGVEYVAARMRGLLEDSQILASHLDCNRVQDPYSLRCVPQVHGASRAAWQHLRKVVETEIDSVTDNPILIDGEAISGGNFHGQPLALPLDYACLAAAEVGNISDRRSYLLLEGKVEGLPELLMKNSGVNSGFMIPQYTSAALVSENKGYCFPASADSIPTSLGQEDHVSMGSISGRKLAKVLDNLENILAVELLCAAQAFDFRRPLKSGPILEACHDMIRHHIHHAEEDRIFSEDLQVASGLISSGSLVECSRQIQKQLKKELVGGNLEQAFRLS